MTAHLSAPPRVGMPLLHASVTDVAGPNGCGVPVRPMVLLHGVFMDESLWVHVLPKLAGMRIIRVDMPSHGRSPDLAAGSTLDDHVTAVAATLDALGIRDAVVVGHSWGGMVGMRLARRRPEIVAGLVLSNTPLLRVRGTSRAGFHLQRLLLAAGLPASLYGRVAAAALIGAERRAEHPLDVEGLAGRTRGMGRNRVRDTLRSVLLEPVDALDLLASLAVPWTAVVGQDDYVLSARVRAALAPSGRMRVARGGHTTPLEDPGVLVDATLALVADLEAPIG